MDKESKCAIVLCVGGTYWSHAAVVVASIVEHARNLEFVIFHDRADSKWQSRIENIAAKNSSLVYFKYINKEIADGFQNYAHLEKSAYYRLFVPSILDSKYEKFLYLDADVIVLKSIEPILSLDLDGKILAGRNFFVQDEIVAANKKLERPFNAPYFNSGVLFVDRVKWLENKITEKAIDLLVQAPERVSMADQCAINHAVGDDFLPLALEWNVTMQYWYPSTRPTVPGVTFENLLSARNDPAIVHYNGPTKPWHMADKHPYKHLYTRTRRKFYQPLYIADDFFPEVLKMVKTSPQNLANFCRRVLRKIKRLSGL